MTYSWCVQSNGRNGGKPVFVRHCQNSGSPKTYYTKDSLLVPAVSLTVSGFSRGCLRSCLLCDCPVILLFADSARSDMASSDDTEASLTPVDFIQLQHYMECKFFISIYIFPLNNWHN